MLEIQVQEVVKDSQELQAATQQAQQAAQWYSDAADKKVLSAHPNAPSDSLLARANPTAPETMEARRSINIDGPLLANAMLHAQNTPAGPAPTAQQIRNLSPQQRTDMACAYLANMLGEKIHVRKIVITTKDTNRADKIRVEFPSEDARLYYDGALRRAFSATAPPAFKDRLWVGYAMDRVELAQRDARWATFQELRKNTLKYGVLKVRMDGPDLMVLWMPMDGRPPGRFERYAGRKEFQHPDSKPPIVGWVHMKGAEGVWQAAHPELRGLRPRDFWTV
jgi:hypothetical protein